MRATCKDVIEKLAAAEPYLTCLLAVTGEEDDMPFLYTNRRFWEYLGYHPDEKEDDCRNRTLSELLAEEGFGKEAIRQAKYILDPEDTWRARCCLLHKSGKRMPARCLSRRLFVEGGEIIWIHQFMPIDVKDLNPEQSAAKEMDQLLRLDYLTGILNRSAFTGEVSEILKTFAKQRHAFIMLDIDCFKQINDRSGHVYGDTILQSVAEKLQKSMRSEDLCGRLGGDEFVIFLRNIPNRKVILDKLNGFCRELCIKSEHGSEYTCSLGAALFPEDGETFEDLYRNADKAMYYVKRRGKNGFAIYDKAMDD